MITILPASVMGEYFERPNVTIIPPNSILSIKKIKKKTHLLRIYNEVK